MINRSRSPRRLARLLAAVAAAAVVLPSLAYAQGQIDTGRANDANNRVGSGGRNAVGMNGAYYSNSIVNNGNRIVTGNVTQGREFHGNVGYTDPYAFRGQTAGIVSDDFAKNSVGAPHSGAPEPVPNSSVPFYGQSQTVQAPPGFQLNASKTGYVPPAPTTGQRGLQDQRMGVVDLNQPITPTPTPGDIMMRGSLNPQDAAQQAGILTGSTLYGVRQWNPQDPADRAFLENILNRGSGAFQRTNLDPQDVKRMRDELERALQPGDQQQQQQQQGAAQRPQDSLTLNPLNRSFESPTDPTVNNRPINDQVQLRPLGTSGNGAPEPGMRYNLLGKAQRTSTQYAELQKRLEQYDAGRREANADAARQFNADIIKRQAAEKAAKDKQAQANANTNPNDLTKPNTPRQPGDKTAGNDTEKPKVKRPQPVKIGSLAVGVRGEGLGNVLKKAETLMKEGKFASALDQYDAAEAVTPNNPLIWLGRANAELGAGYYGRAEGHLKEAFTADQALLMGQYDLTSMIGQDNLTKSVADLKDLANKNPNQATHLFLLAYIAYNTGHEPQALGYLDLAEKRAPEQAGFYRVLKEHWALPDNTQGGKPADAAPPAPKPQTGTPTPRPELNK
ncbi:MAG TPA: hypothetical protein VH475_28080 [Tepidisphaeraceae bacterium]|jgi:tetratricopeptide (TPR) repeat protein